MTNAELKQHDVLLASHNVRENLAQAIKTMRSFLDDAERDIKRYEDDPARAVSQVVHQLAWGNANAISAIENAMRYADEWRTAKVK